MESRPWDRGGALGLESEEIDEKQWQFTGMLVRKTFE